MDKELTISGRNFYYHIEGSGHAIILVHGFGETGSIWDNQLSFLKDKFTVILPDLPGSGRSAIQQDMSIEGMAECIHGIIHEENIETCTMLGHSMGGYIVLAFAEKYWNHLNGFGLIHSTAYADSEEKKSTRRKGMADIQKDGAFAFLKITTPKLFSPITKEKNATLIENFCNSLSAFFADALIAYYEAMIARPDRTIILREARIPVLYNIGKYDTAIPMEDMLKQSHLSAISHINLLENSGHMGMIEEIGKTNHAIHSFLTTIHTKAKT